MTSRPTRVCPECGKRAVKRLIGAGGAVLFRGSGFYATDYRSKGYKEAAKKEKDSQGKKETESKGKKETGGPQKGGEKKSSNDK